MNGLDYGTIPPITIQTSSPSPEGLQIPANRVCMLPPINPHASIMNGGQVPANAGMDVSQVAISSDSLSDTGSQQQQTWTPTSSSADGDNSCLYKRPFETQRQMQIKEEPSVSAGSQKIGSTLLSHPAGLQSIYGITSSGGPHYLQIPNGGYSAVSSDFSLGRFSYAGSAQGDGDGKSKVKPEQLVSRAHLPPLAHLCSSKSDLEEANPSQLNPPLHSFSPYFGSGISEVPSFPSLVSPASAHHLSRKRPLSTSPQALSDFIELHNFHPHPSSLLAIINPAAAVTTAPISSHPPTSHPLNTLSTPNPPPAKHTPYMMIQKRKTSIEQNHNIDGTTNTTITNQITFRDNSLRKIGVEQPDNHGALMAEEEGAVRMEFESKYSRTSPPVQQTQGSCSQEEYFEPRACMWNGCGQEFTDLDDLVQHIESTHIEKGKTDNFTCMWQSCPRNCKPFNARYKLLIHMRIHSGEKPNKCSVCAYFLFMCYGYVQCKPNNSASIINVNTHIYICVCCLPIQIYNTYY